MLTFAGGLTKKELKKFTTPPVMTLIGAICAADALYMLSLYQVTLEANLV